MAIFSHAINQFCRRIGAIICETSKVFETRCICEWIGSVMREISKENIWNRFILDESPRRSVRRTSVLNKVVFKKSLEPFCMCYISRFPIFIAYREEKNVFPILADVFLIIFLLWTRIRNQILPEARQTRVPDYAKETTFVGWGQVWKISDSWPVGKKVMQ